MAQLECRNEGRERIEQASARWERVEQARAAREQAQEAVAGWEKQETPEEAGDDSETQRAGRETAMAGARNRAAGIYAQYACHGSCTG